MTKDDWLTSNLDRRFKFGEQFSVKITPTKLTNMTFKEASNYTANLMTGISDNLYVSLSGGMDSEYVVKTLYDNNIKFTPIIVVFEGNELESQYAFRQCGNLGITPIVINLSDDELVTLFRYIHMKNSTGEIALQTLPSIAASIYAQGHNGIAISGDHPISDKYHKTRIELGEIDFYIEVIDSMNIQFMLYTPEIAYSLIKAISEFDNIQEAKAILYDVVWRPKINHRYNTRVLYQFRSILDGNGNLNLSKKFDSKHSVIYYDITEFESILGI